MLGVMFGKTPSTPHALELGPGTQKELWNPGINSCRRKRGRIGKREKSHGDPNPTRLWPTLHELEEYYPSKLFHVRLNWPGL